MSLKRPAVPNREPGANDTGAVDFWERSWVSSVDTFHSTLGPSFYIAQDRGEGLISHGTRDWTDYRAVAHDFVVNLGPRAGLAVRVQGLNRYYAVMFIRGGKVALVKAADEERIDLVAAKFKWTLDTKYRVELSVMGADIYARVGEVELRATDAAYTGGAVGLVVAEGSLSADSIDIEPRV